MFFKKALSPEQFEFATIIGTANLMKQTGRMPSTREIEDTVQELAKGVNGKLSSSQIGVLKAAASLLVLSSELQEDLEKISKAQDPNGEVYAGLVKKMQRSAIRFAT